MAIEIAGLHRTRFVQNCTALKVHFVGRCLSVWRQGQAFIQKIARFVDAVHWRHVVLYLEDVIALFAQRAGDERRHGIGRDDQRLPTARTTETESLFGHFGDERPFFNTRLTTTIEPVAFF